MASGPAADQAQRQEAERERMQAHRRSAAGAEERRRWRDAYRDASGPEALQTARARFGAPVTDPGWQALDLPPGDRVRHYLDDRHAQVQLANGRTAIAQSTTPLRAKDRNGDLSPIDLSLVRTPQGIEPKTALAPITFGERATEQLTLRPSGIGVSYSGARPSAASISDGAVFYANVAPDTDYFARPGVQGVETFVQLRSPASPEDPKLHLDLPEGVHLRRAALPPQVGPGITSDVVEVVRGNHVLATVLPPSAVDAQGLPVPIDYGISGNDLVMRVAHREKDYAYPILVDPWVMDRFYGWSTPEGAAADGWLPGRSHEVFGVAQGNNGDPTYGGPGLYAWSIGGWNGYHQWDNAYWYWRSPPNTYIFRADFTISHNAAAIYPNWVTAAYSGILNSGFTAWETGWWGAVNGPQCCVPYGYNSPTFEQYPFANGIRLTCVSGNALNGAQCDESAGTESNIAVAGLSIQFNGGTYASTGWINLTNATVLLQDRKWPTAPTISHGATLPAGWVDSFAENVGAGAHDDGLGLWYFTFTAPKAGGGSDTQQRAHTCAFGDTTPFSWGNRHSRCPNDWSVPATAANGFSYSAATMPEGDNTLGVTATDIVSKTGAAATWNLKVDRSAPTIALSGAMYDRREQAVDHRREGLYAATYALQISAADGIRGSTADQQRSGVQTIKVKLDGQDVHLKGPDVLCVGDSCPLTTTYSLATDTVADGRHTIDVVATDKVGHPSTSTFAVVVDRRGDIYKATEYLVPPVSGGTAVATEWARLNTLTARREDDTHIATRRTVTCDQVQAGAQCDEVRLRTLLSQESTEATEAYEVVRGSSTTDPSLAQVADILRYTTLSGSPTATGPIEDAAAPWQALPPAHGTSYQKYEYTRQDPEGEIGVRVWLDTSTKFPIKTDSWSTADPATIETMYFSYDLDRLTSSQVASDFFAVARPGNTTTDTSVESRGPTHIPTATDTQTGQSFTSYYLGAAPLVLTTGYCLASTDLVGMSSTLPQASAVPDPAFGPSASNAPKTLVEASYRANGTGTCAPGGNDAPDPQIEVVSMASSSTESIGWRDGYMATAAAIQTDPTNSQFSRGGIVPVLAAGLPAIAYVVPRDANTTVTVMELGGTLVMLTGPFDKTNLQLVLWQLAAE
jgi:hypothetical protein